MVVLHGAMNAAGCRCMVLHDGGVHCRHSGDSRFDQKEEILPSEAWHLHGQPISTGLARHRQHAAGPGAQSVSRLPVP